MFRKLIEFLRYVIVLYLRNIGLSENLIKFLEGMWLNFWWDLTTPYRWLDLRINRVYAKIVKKILEKFGYTVESPFLEEDEPGYLPWYKNWNPPSDPLGFPTLGEFWFHANIWIFFVCCDFVWTTVAQMYFHIPVSFENVFRAFLSAWTILLMCEWFSDLIK